MPDALTTWNQSNLAPGLAPVNVRYGLGSNVKVVVTFSDAVYVLGRPYIDLYLVGQGQELGQGKSNTNSSTKALMTLVLFTAQIDTRTLLFSTPFSRIAHAGRLGCRAGTRYTHPLNIHTLSTDPRDTLSHILSSLTPSRRPPTPP